jgi:hypothetical protein
MGGIGGPADMSESGVIRPAGPSPSDGPEARYRGICHSQDGSEAEA